MNKLKTYCYQRYATFVAFLSLSLLSLPAYAKSPWDATPIVTAITQTIVVIVSIGTAILSVIALIFAFGLIKRMIGR